ncbi:MAG: 2-oxo-tetronate isomerase [Janthinobacterium lividum]
MPRFAANLSLMFNEVPYLDRFEAAAKAGFKAVESQFPYDYPAQEIASRLQRYGLENILFNLPPGDFAAGERGLAILPGREADFRAAVERAIDYANACGTRMLHVMAGILPAQADPGPYLTTFLENLRFAAEAMAAHGLTALIEPINVRDIPGYLLNTQAQAQTICVEVGAPNLKIMMDFYHCQIVEGDLATRLRQHYPFIGHVQLAGAPGRHEPDRGEINYPYLFGVLDELGYDGWIGCEYRPAGSTLEGLGWMPAGALQANGRL